MARGFGRQSPRERRDEEAKAHRDKVVEEFGPEGARNILRQEDPDRYEFSDPGDFDDSWDYID